MSVPSDILFKHWGYKSFRPLQEDIIDQVLKGRDVLALLPTGGGKSICYQIPGLMLSGICIVISPLIALMKDQIANLRNKGIIAESVSSQLSRRDIDRILDNCIYGNVKFLFIAPERISNDLFQARLSRMEIGLIAVDEAHCISQWGHEFRPAYRKIADIRELRPKVPIIALTATATPEVVKDIQEQLLFKEENLIQQSFSRKNIRFKSIQTENKRGTLLDLVKAQDKGSMIVYVRSRRRCRELSDLLNSSGYGSTFYHAGLSNDARNKAQQDWIDGKSRLIVATNAFGMGIDKSDVRCVIHYDLSDSIESYYQEAGRAGRDGQPSIAVQIFNDADISETRRLMARSYPNLDTIKKVYQVMSDRLGLAAGSGAEETFGIDISELAKNASLGVVATLGSLKCLEQNGYIQIHRGLKEPSKVQMTLDRARLMSLQDEDSDLGRLIHAMMRHRTGLYTTAISIREEELAKLSSLPVKSIDLLLHKAHQRGILEFHPRKGTSSLTYLLARQYDRDLRLDAKMLKELRERTIHKQNALIYYLKNDVDCRMAQILAYFGEEVTDGCGVCDVCQRAGSITEGTRGNSLLYLIRKDLHTPQDIEVLKKRFSLAEPKRAEILRWSIDKGFIKMEKGICTWIGPQLKLAQDDLETV